MKDVAEKAGVSVTTVSHVINETRLVSDETRQRVLTAMKELGYSPNALARSLRRKEDIRVTSSFGVSAIKQGAENPEALIDQADQALYHAKQSGRNRVCRFDRLGIP